MKKSHAFFADKHPGIRIDRIPAAGRAGAIFAVGTMVILLIGLPVLRDFFTLALTGGVLFAAALYYWHNQTRW